MWKEMWGRKGEVPISKTGHLMEVGVSCQVEG